MLNKYLVSIICTMPWNLIEPSVLHSRNDWLNVLK